MNKKNRDHRTTVYIHSEYLHLCDNTLLAGPHYLNLLNHSWPSDPQVVSLISSQGYFTYLHEHTKHNKHKREGRRKRTNNHGLGLVPSPRREKSVYLWASTSVYSRNISTKSPGTQTHPLTSANPASEYTDPSSRFSRPSDSPDFCRLPRSTDCPVLSGSLLPTALICRLVSSLPSCVLLSLGSFFPRPLSTPREISRASPLYGFRTKKDKGILWLAPTSTHRESNAPPHRITFVSSLRMPLITICSFDFIQCSVFIWYCKILLLLTHAIATTSEARISIYRRRYIFCIHLATGFYTRLINGQTFRHRVLKFRPT